MIPRSGRHLLVVQFGTDLGCLCFLQLLIESLFGLFKGLCVAAFNILVVFATVNASRCLVEAMVDPCGSVDRSCVQLGSLLACRGWSRERTRDE